MGGRDRVALCKAGCPHLHQPTVTDAVDGRRRIEDVSAPNEIAHLNSASSIASGLAVDAEKNTLMLETRDGVKQVPVAIAATIRGGPR